jgi:preprotein translocase subunit SecD
MADRRRRVLGLIAAGLLVGCGTSHRATLRISGEGGIGPVLSRADVQSARADVDPRTSQPVLLLDLTPSGGRKLLALVTRVSKTGRRRHHSLHVLISVNGKVISQQEIVYNINGGPVPGPPKGFVVDVASTRAAHDLAARLNR